VFTAAETSDLSSPPTLLKATERIGFGVIRPSPTPASPWTPPDPNRHPKAEPDGTLVIPETHILPYRVSDFIRSEVPELEDTPDKDLPRGWLKKWFGRL